MIPRWRCADLPDVLRSAGLAGTQGSMQQADACRAAAPGGCEHDCGSPRDPAAVAPVERRRVAGARDLQLPFADGRKQTVYLERQLVPAYALRPRKYGRS